MAGTDYKVNSTDLDAIVDAINAKTGGSSQIEFPDGFVSAIQTIPSGGGTETIVFYVNNYGATFSYESFIAEAGMTWEDFLGSKYNPNFTAGSSPSYKRFTVGQREPGTNIGFVQFAYVNSSGGKTIKNLSGGTRTIDTITDGAVYRCN